MLTKSTCYCSGTMRASPLCLWEAASAAAAAAHGSLVGSQLCNGWVRHAQLRVASQYFAPSRAFGEHGSAWECAPSRQNSHCLCAAAHSAPGRRRSPAPFVWPPPPAAAVAAPTPSWLAAVPLRLAGRSGPPTRARAAAPAAQPPRRQELQAAAAAAPPLAASRQPRRGYIYYLCLAAARRGRWAAGCSRNTPSRLQPSLGRVRDGCSVIWLSAVFAVVVCTGAESGKGAQAHPSQRSRRRSSRARHLAALQPPAGHYCRHLQAAARPRPHAALQVPRAHSRAAPSLPPVAAMVGGSYCKFVQERSGPAGGRQARRRPGARRSGTLTSCQSAAALR